MVKGQADAPLCQSCQILEAGATAYNFVRNWRIFFAERGPVCRSVRDAARLSSRRERPNHVCSCASRHVEHDRVERNCRRQHRTTGVAASAGGCRRARVRRARSGIYGDMSCDRIAMGTTDLGHLLAMGWPHDIGSSVTVSLHRLHCACRCW